eukprot:gene8760-14786_t
MKRKLGGRGLINISDCVNGETRSVGHYIAKGEEQLFNQDAVEMGLTDAELEEKNQHQGRVTRERKEKLEAMQLHGRIIMGVAPKWRFKKRKREFVSSCTRPGADAVMKDIYHTTATNKCRLYKERVENVDHIVAGCKILAQKEYKRRHDKVS